MKTKSALVMASVAGLASVAVAGPEKVGPVVTDQNQMRPAGHIVIDMNGEPGIAGPTFRYDNLPIDNLGSATLGFLPGQSIFEPDRSNWIADDATLIDGGPELDAIGATVWNCFDSDGNGFCDNPDVTPGEPLGPTIISVDVSMIFLADWDPGAAVFIDPDSGSTAGEIVEIDFGTIDLTNVGGLAPAFFVAFTFSDIAADNDIIVPTEIAGDNPTIGAADDFPQELAGSDLTFIGISARNPVTVDQGDVGEDATVADIGFIGFNQVQNEVTDWSIDAFALGETGFVFFGGDPIANFGFEFATVGDAPNPCPPDLTGPGGDGVPDGNVTADDFFFYLGLFSAGDPDADLTGPGGDGVPDGNVSADDFFFYLGLFAAGCP